MDSISYEDYLEGATEPRFENSYQVILFGSNDDTDKYSVGESDIEEIGGRTII